MTTKKLAEFSPEQEALIDSIYQEYLADVGVYRDVDRAAVNAWLSICYGEAGIAVPSRVEIVDSPKRALALATELTGAHQSWIDWRGYGDRGWLARADFATRVGLAVEEAKAAMVLKRFTDCAWGTVLLDDCAIVIRRPTQIHVDEDGNLHASDSPCVEWRDGEQDFAWHGVWVAERMIVDPHSFTRDEYLAITDTEERRALSESGGWDWVVRLLDASNISDWMDPSTGLSYSLLACPDGRFLRKQSPKLQDGSQPIYFEPVDPGLITAAAARKWQATSLSVAECESDSRLSFGQES